LILHADMDAFYASVEQRDDPALRGRPVIVGGTTQRGVVSAASYEARVFGVHSAMPTAQARALCPRGVFLPGDMAKYRAESQRIFEIFARFSPRVEPLSLDEAFLDLAGCERLLGPVQAVAQALRQAVREQAGLAVSCGVAPVKLVAKIASGLAKPDGYRVVDAGELRQFLAPLPVSLLWGVGPVLQARLAALGVQRIGEFAAWSQQRARAALGEGGPRLVALARGEDSRRVQPDRRAQSYGEENTFERDVSEPALLRRTLRSHAEAVARRLRSDGVRAGGLAIKLKLARPLGGGRFALCTRSESLERPSDDGRELADAACRLLERAGLREPVRLVGVLAQRIVPAAARQASLFEAPAALRRSQRLNAVLDEVQARFGRAALARGQAQVERSGLSVQLKAGTD
jgi:DNA polymerase-4